MPYTLPTFNILCNIWRYSLNPRSTSPTLSDIPCNLQYGRKIQVAPEVDEFVTTTQLPNIKTFNQWMHLLLPALTDIRPGWLNQPAVTTPENDWVEVPAGSARFYVVVGVEDVSKGFATEYRTAIIAVSPPWPTPIP
jgi:hypothetical protein